MFDLNKAIAGWKERFARQRSCSRDELNELESHLREQVDALVAGGESESDAFATAVDQLGEPTLVCDEFAKNGRLSWLDAFALSANRVLIVVAGVLSIGLAVLATWRGNALLGAHVASITFAYLVASLSCLIGVYAIIRSVLGKAADGEFRDRLDRQCRNLLWLTLSMTAVGFLLGACWSHQAWGRYFQWHPQEIGALVVFGIAMSLNIFVANRRASTMRLGQVALAMSFVTLVAWFGPSVLQ